MIKNYSTEVPAERTVGEMSSLLIRKGARSITSMYSEAGQLIGVQFVMAVGGMPVTFALPCNTEGVAAAMLKDKPWTSRMHGSSSNYKDRVMKQAAWVAWRILKDWVAAQLALIESGQAEAGQVFMPYALNVQEQRTMYQLWVENNQKQLGSGE